MKRLFKKAASIGLCAVMAASVFVTGAVSTAVTTAALYSRKRTRTPAQQPTSQKQR